MIKMIIVLLLSCTFTTTTYTTVDNCRITTYCPTCNDGAGYECTAGKKLEYGDCAANWLPNGTKVSIEGEIFTVNDTCGVDNTIDIFVDTEECRCDLLENRKVVIINENVRKTGFDMVVDTVSGMASKRLD